MTPASSRGHHPNPEKVMTVIVTACREFGLTVSEAKTETMLLHSQTGTLGINAGGQAYKQADNFVYLGHQSRRTATSPLIDFFFD